MTRSEVFNFIEQVLEDQEDEDGFGVPLFQVTESNNTVRVIFNDPRYENIEMEYEDA